MCRVKSYTPTVGSRINPLRDQRGCHKNYGKLMAKYP